MSSLNKYRNVYENNILFRKPPLLGPPLSLPETPVVFKRTVYAALMPSKEPIW